MNPSIKDQGGDTDHRVLDWRIEVNHISGCLRQSSKLRPFLRPPEASPLQWIQTVCKEVWSFRRGPLAHSPLFPLHRPCTWFLVCARKPYIVSTCASAMTCAPLQYVAESKHCADRARIRTTRFEFLSGSHTLGLSPKTESHTPTNKVGNRFITSLKVWMQRASIRFNSFDWVSSAGHRYSS